MQLLTGHTIAVFSNKIEILSMTIYLFQQFFYPLSHDETVKCFSPTKYFSLEFFSLNLIGFLCSYEEINNYNPFNENEGKKFRFLSEDEENEDLEYSLFGCDFVLDLDKKNLEYVNNNNSLENYEEHKENTLKILEFTKRLLSLNKVNENSYLECSLKRLIIELKEIAYKLTYLTNENQKILNYFNPEYKFNRRIQNAFYQFNLEISYEYYECISKYNGNYNLNKDEQIKTPKTLKESGLNEDEYLFFILFSRTLYCNILNNFVGGYSSNEPVIYKTPRIIFENFITLKKSSNISDDTNSLLYNYFDIIDEIYKIKD